MGQLYKVIVQYHMKLHVLTILWPVAGLQLAHIHTIFQLPPDNPLKSNKPLAYVERFTALPKPDSLSGYHYVTKSSWQKGGIYGPYAEIIPVHRIVCNAMLVIKPGHKPLYLFNSHIDMHTFCMVKVGCTDCLPIWFNTNLILQGIDKVKLHRKAWWECQCLGNVWVLLSLCIIDLMMKGIMFCALPIGRYMSFRPQVHCH